MPDGVVLSPELAALVQRMVRQYMNSFQPRPKRLRRLVRGTVGGEVEVATDRQFMRVTEEIPPAQSNLAWGWGVGRGKLLDKVTGAEAAEDQPIGNRWPIAWPVDAMIEIGPLGVENGTCGPLDNFWGEEEPV